LKQAAGLIIEGQAKKGAMPLHALTQFAQKVRYLVTEIARMGASFDDSFPDWHYQVRTLSVA